MISTNVSNIGDLRKKATSNGSRRKKFSLELNSHSLSYFQQCEKRFQFSELELLVSQDEYYPFKRGAGISTYLGLWYLAKKKNYEPKKLQKLEDFLFKKMLKTDAFINHKYNEDDRLHIASRLVGYFNKFRTENYPVIAVEEGFSKTIYEDNNVLFIYSGRPDLVVDFGEHYGIGPIDHKSESRANDIIKFSNQFAGYCWALGSRMGIINYIGLQKDCQHNKVLRREAFTFTDGQIKKWQDDTIRWYFRAMSSIVNKNFLRSWNCAGKYGNCLYHPICTSQTEKEELIHINRDYAKLDKPYRSW